MVDELESKLLYNNRYKEFMLKVTPFAGREESQPE